VLAGLAVLAVPAMLVVLVVLVGGITNKLDGMRIGRGSVETNGLMCQEKKGRKALGEVTEYIWGRSSALPRDSRQYSTVECSLINVTNAP
jgi:hypothetical protein